MKKVLSVVLVLMLLFAFAPVASAASMQAGAIIVSAQTIDYVSALAGIAKPSSAAHNENERIAVLVTISVPAWFDTSNMGVEIKCEGVATDGGTALPVASGNYIIFGTLYSAAGKLKIVIQDYAINSATTVQELYAALYGDRSVSTEVSFAPAAAYQNTIPTTQTIEPPQTGDAPSAFAAVAMIAAAILCACIATWRRRKAVLTA